MDGSLAPCCGTPQAVRGQSCECATGDAEQTGYVASVLFPNPQSLFDGLRAGFVNTWSGNLAFRRRDIVTRAGSRGLRPRPRLAYCRERRLRPRLAAVAGRGTACRRGHGDLRRRIGRAARVRADRNGVDGEPADAPPRRHDARLGRRRRHPHRRAGRRGRRAHLRAGRRGRRALRGPRGPGRPPANSSSTTTADG